MRTPRQGFTLVEVMLIIAIVIVLIMIGMPRFLESKKKTNEENAIASLHAIARACALYKASVNPQDFPKSLKMLCADPYRFIDKVLAGGTKNGYRYQYVRIDVQKFACYAFPLKEGITADAVFFVDESGIVRKGGPEGESVP